MVTGLRVLAEAAPKGECELHLTCAAGSSAMGLDDDGETADFVCRYIRAVERSVFMRARDMIVMLGKVAQE